mmetsp:Transcript_5212/g.12557  ORF Transcript_5212/g.12557 Transcript_5212/m.12557 type:complete len:535 (+) Transcript_5212:93-1697(+)
MRHPESSGYRALKPIAVDEQANAHRQGQLSTPLVSGTASATASQAVRQASLRSAKELERQPTIEEEAGSSEDEILERQGLCEQCAAAVHKHNQTFFGAVITLNMLVLWGETDKPGLWVWDWVDIGFMLLFILEWFILVMCWRPSHNHHSSGGFLHNVVDMHCHHHDCYWNCFDSFLVALGSFEVWIARPLHGGKPKQTGFFQLLWLLRQLRIVRVFRMFNTLKVFCGAVAEMMYDFTWIFLVMFIAFVVCGVPLTYLLGHGEALEVPMADDEDGMEAYQKTRENFQDVATTLFTLFKLTTADNWDQISDPLLALDGRWRPFFVVFIAFASWMMLSVLTAIASDKIIDATSNRKELEQRERERKHKQFLLFLRDSFLDADADGNGFLDKEEFEEMMKKDEVHARMRQLGVRLSEEDLKRAWDMLDVDENPAGLQIDDFVDGLKFLQEGLATKHVVTVDYSLKRIDKRFHNHIELLTTRAKEVTGQKEFFLQHIPVFDATHVLRLNAFAQQRGLESTIGPAGVSTFGTPSIPLQLP